jgi:hypothetical protein
MDLDPSGDERRVADANNVKTEAYQCVRYVFCKRVLYQMAYHRLHRLSRFWIERVTGQVVVGVEVGFDGLEIRHDSRSVSSAAELKSFP